MQCLIVLCCQVLSSKNDDIQRPQVSTMPKRFPDHSLDTVSLDSVFQVPLRENQAESGPPKMIGRRQNQEVPVGYSDLDVIEYAGIIRRSQ